jgi:hypothetical protein
MKKRNPNTRRKESFILRIRTKYGSKRRKRPRRQPSRKARNGMMKILRNWRILTLEMKLLRKSSPI